MRPVLCWSLVLFQVVAPALCHEHADEAAPAAPGRGPHVHVPLWPFAPSDHDEDDHDHDADALYLPAFVFQGATPPPEAAAPAGFAIPLTMSWPSRAPALDAPDPVAHSPPSGRSRPFDRPIYLTTLALLI